MTAHRPITNEATPGPWTVCDDDEFDGCPFIPIETDKPVGPELQLICEVRGSSPDLLITDNDRANARLIAAAPDYHAAALKLIKAADEGDADLSMEGYDDLRAAITKATGGAQ
ncbi:hypothetical protein [Sphingopyxis sp. JAI128]|uniref:hypothetical protein n=1 Tax=Sphingopyxis sp. JAI128 TaxID=2723066 RepID=UPI00160B328B|nr:hypothetical protein [Sphingopyxis sp. JAI128]MBB6424982.1 hypothetical protein [Sphingopyxis sp. JAI128]